MSLREFKKMVLNGPIEEKDTVRVINVLQNNVEDSIKPLLKVQNDAILLQNVALIAGKVNSINHTLGRQLASWSAAPKSQAIIWDAQDLNPAPNLTLWLWTSVSVTANITVY